MFAWTVEEIPGSGGYRVIRSGERANGGMMSLQLTGTGADTPPAWLPYFGHEDVDRAIEEVPRLGGQVLNGPVRMPQGSIADARRPPGAVFAVWTGAYED